MLPVRSPKDLLSGVLFMALGAFAIIFGSRYNLGTAAQMGPGYFPRILGSLMVLLGAAIAVRSIATSGPGLERWQARALLPLAMVVVFALIVQTTGLLIASVVLVIGASVANPGFRPVEMVISSVALALFTAAVFVMGLGMQLPILPPTY